MFRCYAIEILYSPKDDLLYTSREFHSFEHQLAAKLVQYDIIDSDIGSSLHFFNGNGGLGGKGVFSFFIVLCIEDFLFTLVSWYQELGGKTCP